MGYALLDETRERRRRMREGSGPQEQWQKLPLCRRTPWWDSPRRVA